MLSSGTSFSESPAQTQAEIRSATMSLARFGYQPTVEQVLSGNIGIDHPTQNMDTTNLEPIGPSPTDAAAAVPGILSTILGELESCTRENETIDTVYLKISLQFW